MNWVDWGSNIRGMLDAVMDLTPRRPVGVSIEAGPDPLGHRGRFVVATRLALDGGAWVVHCAWAPVSSRDLVDQLGQRQLWVGEVTRRGLLTASSLATGEAWPVRPANAVLPPDPNNWHDPYAGNAAVPQPAAAVAAA